MKSESLPPKAFPCGLSSDASQSSSPPQLPCSSTSALTSETPPLNHTLLTLALMSSTLCPSNFIPPGVSRSSSISSPHTPVNEVIEPPQLWSSPLIARHKLTVSSSHTEAIQNARPDLREKKDSRPAVNRARISIGKPVNGSLTLVQPTISPVRPSTGIFEHCALDQYSSPLSSCISGDGNFDESDAIGKFSRTMDVSSALCTTTSAKKQTDNLGVAQLR